VRATVVGPSIWSQICFVGFGWFMRMNVKIQVFDMGCFEKLQLKKSNKKWFYTDIQVKP
jgi:hypothetical protein